MVAGVAGKTKALSLTQSTTVKTNKYLLTGLCSLAIQLTAFAQWKAGIEQYVYSHTPLSEGIVPIIYLQSPGNFYGELRYNYEEAKTISLFAGKSFTGGGNFEYKLTPMAGYSTGRFKGVSLAINAEGEWKNFFISSQTQYSIATMKTDSLMVKKNADDFFFSWSETGYGFGEHFFAGLSVQYTRQAGDNIIEPGLLTGLNFQNLSFPFYVFNPFNSNRYFVAGVNYDFSFKKKN